MLACMSQPPNVTCTNLVPRLAATRLRATSRASPKTDLRGPRPVPSRGGQEKGLVRGVGRAIRVSGYGRLRIVIRDAHAGRQSRNQQRGRAEFPSSFHRLASCSFVQRWVCANTTDEDRLRRVGEKGGSGLPLNAGGHRRLAAVDAQGGIEGKARCKRMQRTRGLSNPPHYESKNGILHLCHSSGTKQKRRPIGRSTESHLMKLKRSLATRFMSTSMIPIILMTSIGILSSDSRSEVAY